MDKITEKAIELYDVYTAAVGGKAYDGRTLPSGAEFMADESKKTQADAWCAVAEHVYGSKTSGLSFGEALNMMKHGKAVRLPHWKPDVRIMMQLPDEHSKMTHAYLYVQSRFGCVPWVVTQVELLSMNWEIVSDLAQ